MKTHFACRDRIQTLASATHTAIVLSCLAWAGIAHPMDAHEPWDVTKVRGNTRAVSFTTNEGTWMSVDISADGQWIVFDMLAQIYRVRSTGGKAECLTCDSGAALNYQPRYSPDGKQIAFISDRGSQENLWVMNADGTLPRPVFIDKGSRIYDPTWSADGSFIAATRFIPDIAAYHDPIMEIWSFPVDGSEPRVLARGKTARYRWPSLSPDGTKLYYYTSYPTWSWIGMYVGQFIQERDLRTGAVRFLRHHPGEPIDPEVNPYGDDNFAGGFMAAIPEVGSAELAPEASPDGRYVAFVQRQSGKKITYRGHEYGPRNALVVKDLRTGRERVVADPISTDLARVDVAYSVKVLPGYSWAKDSQSLVYSSGGEIHRVDVESGAIDEVAFTVDVERTISETPRGDISIDDVNQQVRFIQWPSGSRDGKQVVFIAAGRLWLKPLPDGSSRHLLKLPENVIALTPAWSPDGSRIAFATWNDKDGGAVWTIAPDGTGLHRVTEEPGQYAYPAWSPDSKRLVAVRGPGTNAMDEWTGWDVDGKWQVVMLSDGVAASIADVSHETSPHFGDDGRVYYYEQTESKVLLRSVSIDGDSSIVHAILPNLSKVKSPPSIGNQFIPMISPTGDYLAYEAAHSVYVQSMAGAAVPVRIDPSPNKTVKERRRLGAKGGIYHRWRDARTVEFVSGDTYFTYDVSDKVLSELPLNLKIPRASSGKGSVAIKNARIITADEAGVIDKGNIIVRDARIVCVGDCDTSGSSRVIDATGKYVMPGLVDTHAHSTDRSSRILPLHQPELSTQLAYGVTTILDPATSSTAVFPIAEMVEAGLILAPRIYTTAEPAFGYDEWQKGGHIEIEDYRDAEYRVDRRLKWGAISLKNYWMQRRDQQQMFIDVARSRGVTVTAEGVPLHRTVAAVIDGQTGWEHWIPVVPLYADVAKFFGLAGVVYAPTLTICGHPLGALYHYRPKYDLLADAKYARFMPRKHVEAALAGATNMVVNSPTGPEKKEAQPIALDMDEYSVPMVAEGVRDVVQAGGHTAMGAHGEQAGIGAHWDMWAFTEAFTPLEAIEIATLSGAYFHGLEKELGSIRKGKLADLIILNSDPLVDIRNSADIEYVMKAGRLYDADTLEELWPDEAEYAPFRGSASIEGLPYCGDATCR